MKTLLSGLGGAIIASAVTILIFLYNTPDVKFEEGGVLKLKNEDIAFISISNNGKIAADKVEIIPTTKIHILDVYFSRETTSASWTHEDPKRILIPSLRPSEKLGVYIKFDKSANYDSGKIIDSVLFNNGTATRTTLQNRVDSYVLYEQVSSFLAGSIIFTVIMGLLFVVKSRKYDKLLAATASRSP